MPLIFHAILFSFIIGCSQQELSQKPQKIVLSHSQEPVLSDINVNAKIDLVSIQEEINSQFIAVPTAFSQTASNCIKIKVWPIKKSFDCDFDGDFSKSENLNIQGENDKLSASLPGHIRVTGSVKGIAGLQETIHADLNAVASVKPQISENWDLTLNPTFDINWINYPSIKLFDHFKVEVPSTLVQEANKIINIQFQDIISKLISNLNLRAKAEYLWTKTLTPIQLSKNENIWLRLGVQDAHFSGINASNNIVSANFGIRAITEIVTGEPAALDLTTLPPLNTNALEDKGIHLKIPLTISYETLTEQIRTLLKNLEKWNNSIVTLEIKNINIYPSGESIVIDLTYFINLPYEKLDTNGELFISGKPTFQNTDKEISITNLKFITFNDNKFADILGTAISLGVEHIMNEDLKISYKTKYDQFINDLTPYLNKEFSPNIRSHGEIKQIDMNSIFLNNDSLTVLFDAKCNLELVYGKI